MPESTSQESGAVRDLTPWRIGLDHAAVTTRQLDSAVAFYREILGLALRVVESDPIRPGHRRAILFDESGRDVIELIEMPELGHPAVPGRGAIHHIGFRMSLRDWQSLRSRLDARGYAYEEIDRRLFIRDADGLILEIEVSEEFDSRVASDANAVSRIHAT